MKSALFTCQILRYTLPGLLLGWATLISSVALGDIYKWEDEKGVVHYTELPPKDRQATKIQTYHKAPSKPYVPGTNRPASPGNDATSSTEGETPEEKAQAAEYCKIAKSNFDTLQKHPRVRKKDDEGNYYYLPDDEREAEINSAKQAISDYCK